MEAFLEHRASQSRRCGRSVALRDGDLDPACNVGSKVTRTRRIVNDERNGDERGIHKGIPHSLRDPSGYIFRTYAKKGVFRLFMTIREDSFASALSVSLCTFADVSRLVA